MLAGPEDQRPLNPENGKPKYTFAQNIHPDSGVGEQHATVGAPGAAASYAVCCIKATLQIANGAIQFKLQLLVNGL